jgi:TolB-like protein
MLHIQEKHDRGRESPQASPTADGDSTPGEGALFDEAENTKKKKKKKDKIRSAWISFVGRIVAQFIGAAAPLVVGGLLLHKYQGNLDKASSAVPPAAQVVPVRARRNAGETALAVLPLQNFSGDPRQDYFADGMTESLTAGLAQVKSLRVISRTSAMPYKGRHKTAVEIGRELDVDLMVEGSVMRAGDKVRITAQLIDARTDEHVWAGTYDRTIRDVLALQGEIAAAIAREVGRTLDAGAQNQ